MLMDLLMAAVTLAAPPAVFAVAARWFLQGRRREALVLAAALIGAGVLCLELQYILLRPRPEATGLLPAVPTPSFPSGHAALVGALATFLTLARGFTRAAAGAWGGAALVMLSRVWLGHHHAEDVLVGAVVGGAVAALLYGAQIDRGATRPRWAWWIWPQVAVVVIASATAYLGLSDFAWLRVPGADKILHFLLFGLLSFFLVGWLARHRSRWVVFGLAVASTADELLQALSPSRTFDLGDLACTLGGVFVFGAIAARLLRGQVVRAGEGQLLEPLAAEVTPVTR